MNIEWINVKDSLPKIPEGKYGVQVLIAEFDHVYDEISDGHGYTVHQVSYAKTCDRNGVKIKEFEGIDSEEDFMQIAYGHNGAECFPIFDEITHWMYMPLPPKR